MPLTFTGTATPETDYTVTGTSTNNVTYASLNSTGAMVTSTGPSATTAGLTLTATTDRQVGGHQRDGHHRPRHPGQRLRHWVDNPGDERTAILSHRISRGDGGTIRQVA